MRIVKLLPVGKVVFQSALIEAMTPRCFTGLVTVHKYNLQMDGYSDR